MTQRDDFIGHLLHLSNDLHIRYSQGWQRCQPDISGYGDCSGTICWAANLVGANYGCTGSFALARLGHQYGLGMSVAEARNTAGALIFQGINEGQGGVPGRDPGHIGISLGNGQSWEARGHVAGVGVFDFDSLRWVWACRPPRISGFDIAYSNHPKVESKGPTKVAPDFIAMAQCSLGGYWILRNNGAVYAYKDPHGVGAEYYGGANTIKNLVVPPVDICGTRSGKGYWLVAPDGGIFSYGDAKFFGSMGGIKLASPITNMVCTPSGSGYWLVAGDGGVFSFGDAGFFGNPVGLPA